MCPCQTSKSRNWGGKKTNIFNFIRCFSICRRVWPPFSKSRRVFCPNPCARHRCDKATSGGQPTIRNMPVRDVAWELKKRKKAKKQAVDLLDSHHFRRRTTPQANQLPGATIHHKSNPINHELPRHNPCASSPRAISPSPRRKPPQCIAPTSPPPANPTPSPWKSDSNIPRVKYPKGQSSPKRFGRTRRDAGDRLTPVAVIRIVLPSCRH